MIGCGGVGIPILTLIYKEMVSEDEMVSPYWHAMNPLAYSDLQGDVDAPVQLVVSQDEMVTPYWHCYPRTGTWYSHTDSDLQGDADAPVVSQHKMRWYPRTGKWYPHTDSDFQQFIE